MNVLFVCSGNAKEGISPIIMNQVVSLEKEGINVTLFPIKSKGLRGYLNSIIPLRRVFLKDNFDLVHAHYSLSAFVATLAGLNPIVVSLMGSDVNAGFVMKRVIHFFSFFFWKKCIVKSVDMKEKSGLNNAIVLPNGVDLDKFRLIDRNQSQKKVGFDQDKKHILFVANPARTEKNYDLARQAVDLINDPHIMLHAIFDVSNDLMPYYYNAADLLLMTSLWEGSPNAVKEAIACNLPVVSADIGDVRNLIDGVEGSFLANHHATVLANKIKRAFDYTGKINGREKIIEKKLDAVSIAKNLKKIYKKVIDANY